MTTRKGPYTDNISKMCRVLDNNYGTHWPHKIDTDILDVASPWKCVLGQLYGSYINGFRIVSNLDSDELISTQEARNWGRNHAVWPHNSMYSAEIDEEMAVLNELWKRRVKYLQHKRKDSPYAQSEQG